MSFEKVLEGVAEQIDSLSDHLLAHDMVIEHAAGLLKGLSRELRTVLLIYKDVMVPKTSPPSFNPTFGSGNTRKNRRAEEDLLLLDSEGGFDAVTLQGGRSDGDMIPVTKPPENGERVVIGGEVYVFDCTDRRFKHSAPLTLEMHLPKK